MLESGLRINYDEVLRVIVEGSDKELVSMFWFFSGLADETTVGRERMISCYDLLTQRYVKRRGLGARLRAKACRLVIRYLRWLGAD